MTGWLRQKPTTPDNGRVRAVFLRVAADPKFQRIAGLAGAQHDEFLAAVDKASYRFAGRSLGWAGPPDEEGGPCLLGLSWWHLRSVPAAHELFHLARHVRKVKSLDDETNVWREEAIIWGQTLRYNPIGTVLEVAANLAVVLGGPWVLLECLYRGLFGEGVFEISSRLFRGK
jgi:hypothetical protein